MPLALVVVVVFFTVPALAIEGGYASRTSAAQGEAIDFHVSTRMPTFRLTVEARASGSTVHVSLPIGGAEYDCTNGFATGCGWPVAYRLTIPDDWPSGLYTATFDVETASIYTSIDFVVREDDPGSSSNIIAVVPTHTYLAYDEFGGQSFYKPVFRPANLLSYDRPTPPQAERASYYERWAAASAYPVEWATDVDLDADDSLLSHYTCFVTVGHSEYWTREMRDHLDAFTDQGGNAMIFSGNTAWWQVRMTPDRRGVISYKVGVDPITQDGDPSNDHLLAKQWWAANSEDPETRTFGLSYLFGGLHDYADAAGREHFPARDGFGAYKVYRTDDWVFEGTGLADGDLIGQAATIVGYEVDGTLITALDENGSAAWDGPMHYPAPGALPVLVGTELSRTPEDFRILGLAPVAGTLSRHGVMGYFTKPSGGRVFNAGTIDWAVGLESDIHVRKITDNLTRELCAVRNDVRIEVRPGGSRRRWLVILLGSETVDVEHMTVTGLNVAGHRPRFSVSNGWLYRFLSAWDVNRDGYRDLIVPFAGLDLSETGCLDGAVDGRRFRACR